jgi:hypothetical protein
MFFGQPIYIREHPAFAPHSKTSDCPEVDGIHCLQHGGLELWERVTAIIPCEPFQRCPPGLLHLALAKGSM